MRLSSCPTADLDLALRAVAFGAMGTAGQRCTTLRRLIVHEDVTMFPGPDETVGSTVAIDDPRDAGTLVGPLIDRAGVRRNAGVLSPRPSAMAGVVTEGGRMEMRKSSGRLLCPARDRGDAFADGSDAAGDVCADSFCIEIY